MNIYPQTQIFSIMTKMSGIANFETWVGIWTKLLALPLPRRGPNFWLVRPNDVPGRICPTVLKSLGSAPELYFGQFWTQICPNFRHLQDFRNAAAGLESNNWAFLGIFATIWPKKVRNAQRRARLGFLQFVRTWLTLSDQYLGFSPTKGRADSSEKPSNFRFPRPTPDPRLKISVFTDRIRTRPEIARIGSDPSSYRR